MRPSLWIRALALTWLCSFAFLTAPARAQCAPDGLDGGPCCVPTFANLPNFPAMPLQSVRYVCFDNCKPAANISLCAKIFAPAPKQFGGAFVCGAFDIPIRIRQCGLNLGLWSGTLNAYYSRNWQASSIAGTNNLTVWRFIVNGDLIPSINVPNNPLYKPSCYAAFQKVYFSGYIDYAFDCTSSQWQVAWMLDHDCDGVHHQPGTARPAPIAGFHPSRSFNFVGPGTNFAVSSINPLISNGPITQQAVRKNDWNAAPMICTYEEPVMSGFFQATNDFCVCVSTGTPQYNAAILSAGGVCGSGVQPSPLGKFMQKRLGNWTNPNVYPGVQTLLFDFGWLDYRDGCTGASTPEWFEGAETIGGYPAVEFTGVNLGRQFEDVATCNLSASAPVPFIGAPHVVNYLLNFNMP